MITKTVLLACPPARAFALFTQEAGAWWPADRRHTSDPASTITMLETGRFFERASDGREVDLGWVRSWEPPHRLVLDWYPGTDAAHPTCVTVTFTAEEQGTRLTIEHAPGPDSEALWPPRAPRYDRSWDLVLAAIAAYATR